jgi:hypothetical protein
MMVRIRCDSPDVEGTIEYWNKFWP